MPFHNPYGYIWAPPRDGWKADEHEAGFGLADGDPAERGGHDRYAAERISGRLRIEVKTVTPLLLPGPEERTPNQGVILPVRRGPDQGPDLPLTSVKGMLRNAVETVSGSRFGVLADHALPLAERATARQGFDSIPARISDDGNDIELYLGFGSPEDLGRGNQRIPEHPDEQWYPPKNTDATPRARIGWPAWLPTYTRGQAEATREWQSPHLRRLGFDEPVPPRELDPNQLWGPMPLQLHWKGAEIEGVRAVDGSQAPVNARPPRPDRHFWHLDVSARISLRGGKAQVEFTIGGVAVRSGISAGDLPAGTICDGRLRRARLLLGLPDLGYWQVANAGAHGDGFVLVTNHNVGNKHDERLFFTPTGDPTCKRQLTPELRRKWLALMQSYRAAHDERDIWERRGAPEDPWAYLGREPGQTAWSRHLIEAFPRDKGVRWEDQVALKPGSLCYARVDNSGSVKELWPVQISRRVFDKAPRDLLTAGAEPLDWLRPPDADPRARRLAVRRSASLADRLFGFATRHGGYRGHVRFTGVTCARGRAAIKEFDPPLHLSVLATPKPSQWRFTLRDEQGGVPNGTQGFTEGQTIAGRRFYIEAQLPDDGEQRVAEVDRMFPEGLPAAARMRWRRSGPPDKQSRRYRGWVRPETSFEVTLEVENVAKDELGALLYVLCLEPNHHLRLGGGKPYGFGVVRVSLLKSGLCLETGADRRARYHSLSTSPPEHDASLVAESLRSFQEAVERATGQRFSNVSFIRGFRRATRGYGDRAAVHYPRPSPGEDPDAGVRIPGRNRPLTNKSYEWFRHAKNTSKLLPPLDGPEEPGGLDYLAP